MHPGNQRTNESAGAGQKTKGKNVAEKEQLCETSRQTAKKIGTAQRAECAQ